MRGRRDLLLLSLFSLHAVVFALLFAIAGGSLVSLVIGANIGVGLTGAVLYGIRAVGPEGWQVGSEPPAGEES
jgi:hypothetical protein